MTIKEIRVLTGMSQAKFSQYYNIPLSSVKKWESGQESQNHRVCPKYLTELLEKVVRIDFKIQKEERSNHQRGGDDIYAVSK